MSCGCLAREVASTVHANDLTGQKFNRLTAIQRAPNRPNRVGAYWSCSCSCGNAVVASAKGLVCGDNQSCGCLNSENAKAKFRLMNYERAEEFARRRWELEDIAAFEEGRETP